MKLKMMMLTASGCAVFLTAAFTLEAPAEFSWKQCQGSKLRVLVAKKAWPDYMGQFVPEFEKLTGIKVVWEAYPENQHRQKVAIELAAGGGTVDAYMVDPIVNGLKHWSYGWMEPLNSYIDDPNLTLPDFDYYADFTKGARAAVTFDGEIIAINHELDGQIFYYRKDLFEKYGVAVPQTLQEMEKAAAKLTLDTNNDGRIDVYGITLRGMGRKAVSQCSTYIMNLGGWWLDKEGNAAINSPKVVEAFELYGRLLRRYGPPGNLNFDWYEALDAFAAGKAAMYTDAASFLPALTDPAKSKIVGKWSCTEVPAGPAGRHPMLNTWGMAIPKNSRNKKAAWLLTQWLLNKENVLKSLMHGVPAARASAWNSPKFKAQDKYPFWTEACLLLFEKGNPQFQAPVINVEKAKDIVGQIIPASTAGEDVKLAADKANKELQELIESERKEYGLKPVFPAWR